ncbi:hypothetical protein DXG03_005044 [Asterophora parasitica]|uniref:Geranylgeranyl transferase type-2 subunit alpha n=1 Tax=Asterophora parasitica TaxID=117018 RepID=A0A9P7GF76_9AGAR|nr:hypothetical protein DXG03_005044 [Asterophora parasitica]
MHGVRRVRQSQQALEAKKLKEKAKIEEYLALTNDVISRRKNKDLSQDALRLTSRLLQVNPEFYTIWNYRRTIFLDGIFPNSSPEEINTYISDDLSSTMTALKAHPKVYWIWNHRRWCLENTPHGPGSETEGDPNGWKKTNWDKELYVVEKMLDIDPRNFHAWNYRRYVLASMAVKRSEKSELAYTSRKIEANISNFSAWHQRSKERASLLFPPNDVEVNDVCSGEDPELLKSEISAIQELLDEQPDSKCA